MRVRIALVLLLLFALTPVSIRGWGMDVHRYITRRAFEGLPAEMRGFYAPHLDFVSEHAADPDLWRMMDLRGELGTEDPNHFLDIDMLDEPAPFTNVPRDWNAFVARYGTDRANRAGRLPWRTEEVYGKLVTAFKDLGRNSSPYAADTARYLSAVIAHYVEDAHVPFHAVGNHDGQLTNQRGIHARFETELPLRNKATLRLTPVTVRPIGKVKDFIFTTLVESAALVPRVLDADRAAIVGRDAYDDAYFAAFFRDARPIVERRMSDASSGVASVIVAAWTEAGKPSLAPPPPRTPARIIRH